MSDFKFTCPLCNQHITGDESLRGEKIACPGCAAEITVPRAFSAEEAAGEIEEAPELSAAEQVRAELAARLAEEKRAAAKPPEKGILGALKSLVLTIVIWVVVIGAALGIVWQFAHTSGQKAAQQRAAAEEAARPKAETPELQTADKLVRDELFAVSEAVKKYKATVKAQDDLKRSLRGKTLDAATQAEADEKVKVAEAEVDTASAAMTKAYKALDTSIEEYKKLGGTIDYRAQVQ